MVTSILLFIISLVLRAVTCVPKDSSSDCPKKCLCFDRRTRVVCSDRGFVKVPGGLPITVQMLRLDLNRLTELNLDIRLPQLDTLCLDYNRLSIVTPQDFQGFPKLRNLTVKGNQLHRITSWHFNANPLLTYIDLSHNKIVNFPFDILVRLHHLKLLNLAHNHLQSLATDYTLTPKRMAGFRQLEKNIYLNLADNNLTLHKKLLQQLSTNVHTLSLSGNRRIDTQQIRLLALGLKHSRICALEMNRLGILRFSPFIFANVVLHRLVRLSLSGNYISFLEEGTFNSLESIVSLDLSDNRLIAIPNLLKNRRLELLDLSDNLISGLTVAPALPASLKELRLDKNKLQVLDISAFHRLTNLQRLTLSDNLIKQFKGGPRGLTGLRHLDLAGNSAQTRHARRLMKYLQNLQALDLSRNNIDSLEPNLSSWHPTLDYLNLSRNSIKQLHPVDIGARSVSILDLSHNKINILHDYILPRLVELYLQHNEITNIDRDAFRTSVYLRVLDISDNPLQTRIINLQRHIFKRITPHLRVLKMSGIDLDPYVRNSHWAFFQEFEQLRELHLHRCDIKAPPRHTEKLPPRLEYLTLAYNLLSDVTKDSFPHALYLRELDLSHNNLHEMEHTAFMRLAKLNTIHLWGNPFVCNCGDFPEFLAWINRTNISVPGFYTDQLICAHPEIMWNRSIRNFDMSTCGTVYNTMPLVGGLVTAGLILVLAAVPFLIVSMVDNKRPTRSDLLVLHMYNSPLRPPPQTYRFSV